MSVEQRAAAIALALADLGLRPLMIGGHAVRFHGVDHLALVEAARRLHRRAAMAADRADKEQEASGGSEP